MELLIFYLVIGGLLSIAIGSWSERKGHGFAMGFFISLIFSPLVGLIVVGVSEDLSPEQKQAAAAAKMKKCPACAELVQPEARVCRYCHHEFPQPPEETEAEQAKRAWEDKARQKADLQAWEEKQKRNRISGVIIVGLFVLAVIVVLIAPRQKPAPKPPAMDVRLVQPEGKVAEPKATNPVASKRQTNQQSEPLTPPTPTRRRAVELQYPSGSRPTFEVDDMFEEKAWRALAVGDSVSPQRSRGSDTWILLAPAKVLPGAPVGVIVRKFDSVLNAASR